MLKTVKISRKDYDKALCTVIIKGDITLSNSIDSKQLFGYTVLEFKTRKEADEAAENYNGTIEEIVTISNSKLVIVENDKVTNYQPDPSDVFLWGFKTCEVDKALQEFPEASGEGLLIAINDTPFNKDHEDFTDAWEGGFDPYDTNNPWDFKNFHGTHVAGSILARSNGKNITGGLPKAKGYAIAGLSKDGWGYGHKLAEGNQEIIDKKIKFSNHSYGPGTHPLLLESFRVMNELGLIACVAAGNNGKPIDDNTIASLPETVTVVATTQNDTKANFSNFGDFADISAPGQAIYSLNSEGGIIQSNGTSMASPWALFMIAGVWNLAKKRYNKDYDKDRIVRILEDTGTVIENAPPRINYYKALQRVVELEEGTAFIQEINSIRYNVISNRLLIGIMYKKNTSLIESLPIDEGKVLLELMDKNKWEYNPDTKNIKFYV